MNFLIWICSFCLLVLSACSTPAVRTAAAAASAEAEDTLNLIVASDLHYLASSLRGGSSFSRLMQVGDGKLTQYCEELTEAFIDECLQAQPDAVILTGDLTFNGEKLSHEELAAKLQRLTEAGIPVLVLPGNHDIDNPRAYDYSGEEVLYADSISAEDFADIYEDCGYSQAFSRDPASLSYAVRLNARCWILVLDSARYEQNSGFLSTAGGRIRDDTLTWMKDLLRQAQDEGAEVITAMHHNLMTLPFGDDYRVENAGTLLRLYAQYDVRLNLSGHIHAQYQKTLTTEGHDTTDIATASLSVYNHHYGIIHWDPDGDLTYRIQALNMQTWAEEQQLTDPFFDDFDTSSKNFFMENSTSRMADWFAALPVTAEQQEQLRNLVGMENVFVFTGRAPDYAAYLEESGLQELIASLPEEQQGRFTMALTYFPNYADSVTVDMREQS